MWQFHTTHDVRFRAVGFYSYTLLSEATEAVMGQLVSVSIWEVYVCVEEGVWERKKETKRSLRYKILWLSNSKISFTPRTLTILSFTPTDDNVMFILSASWSYVFCHFKCLSWAWVSWILIGFQCFQCLTWKIMVTFVSLCCYRNIVKSSLFSKI